jgi:NIPSNAP
MNLTMKRILLTLLLAAMTMTAADMRVYELRTYTTKEGKLDALLARFRNHTTSLFEKHGMTNIGYWVPKDKPNTLIYIISHASPEAAKKNWDDFRADTDWVKVKTESEASGPIVEKVESVYMTPTDFSKLK